MLWYTIAIGLACFYVHSKPFIFFCRDASDNACTSSSTCDVVEVKPPPAKKPKTLMAFAYSETSWPQFKNTDQVTYLDKYSCDYTSD